MPKIRVQPSPYKEKYPEIERTITNAYKYLFRASLNIYLYYEDTTPISPLKSLFSILLLSWLRTALSTYSHSIIMFR